MPQVSKRGRAIIFSEGLLYSHYFPRKMTARKSNNCPEERQDVDRSYIYATAHS